MTDFVLEVHNVPRVENALGEVKREIESDKLITKAALIVERQAKQNASGRPGPHVQTGRLRSSITTNILSPVQAVVGPNVHYAPYVEFGHIQHPGQFVPPLRKRLVANFAPAYPFMSPVPDQVKGQIDGAIVEFGHNLGSIWNQ